MLPIIISLAALVSRASSLNNGVGRLPKMGYDSMDSPGCRENLFANSLPSAFNAFGCDYDQAKVLAQVDAMSKYGLIEAGYNVRKVSHSL
jgi:alpha-galactosidase